MIEKLNTFETRRNRGNGGNFLFLLVFLLLPSVYSFPPCFKGLLFVQSTLSSIAAVTSFFSICRSMRWARKRLRSAPRLRDHGSLLRRFNGARNISVACARESAEISVLASRLSSTHNSPSASG